jgi:hypothetical protein
VTLQVLLDRLDGWSDRCPAHDDKNPSLSVDELAEDSI